MSYSDPWAESEAEGMPAPCSEECGWCGENMPESTERE